MSDDQTFSRDEIAASIEHTLLKPEAAAAQIDQLCAEAVAYGFAGVCVNPVHVKRAADQIDMLFASSGPGGRRPVVVSVVGFPLGASRSDMKAEEARHALDDGAGEIDMVVQLGALLSGDVRTVRADIEAVSFAVHGHASAGVLKVIIEAAALTDDQIIAACRCCAEGEADFVKTSTGFHAAGGARVEHVALMHKHSAPIRVKAAGGIRDAAAARAMLAAGAARLGCSSSVAIMQSLSA